MSKKTIVTNPAVANVKVPKGLGTFKATPPNPDPITPKQITRGQALRISGAARSTTGKKSL